MTSEIRRVLLVEDDPEDVELILTALERYNLANRIDVARDGKEALDYLFCTGSFSERPSGNPCVMLLDIKLPRISGLEVLSKLRSCEALKNIPVVILSSSREEADLKHGYELGVNAYVVKPVEFKDFVEAVRTCGLFWVLLNEVTHEC